jgi:transcription initiation factor TFIID subunit 7
LLIWLLAEVLENVNPDLSDSEFIERDDSFANAATPLAGSDAGDAPTPGADIGDPDDDDEDEADGEIDEELAAELDLALGDDDEEEEDDDDDDDDDDSDADEDEEDEDEDEDDNEGKQARKLLNEEIRDLEAAVAKKHLEIGSSTNPLIRVSWFYISCKQ